jgi:hypothetical protein
MASITEAAREGEGDCACADGVEHNTVSAIATKIGENLQSLFI